MNEVSSAYSYVNAQSTFYGNALNEAQTQQTFLSTEQVDLSQQQNAVSAADLPSVASQIASDQTAISATLEAIGKMPQNSLFDYLR